MSSKDSRKKYTPETVLLETRINDIKTCINMIGKENRYAAGLSAGLITGFVFGLTLSLILFGIIFHYFIAIP